MPELSTLSGRRVLVTGHSGFKGTWLSLWLRRLGAEVHGLSLALPSEPAMSEVVDLARDLQATLGDVRDGAAVEAVVARVRPEIVFHLAAQPLVGRSVAEPIETFAVNVMGTAHVLAAVGRVESVRAVVVVTSDKCYENRGERTAFRESDPLGGRDPYSASKAAAELVAAAMRASCLPARAALATARAGNVIGGGDWGAHRLLPDLVRAMTDRGGRIEIRNLAGVRPWQHVLEAIHGYLLLAAGLLEAPDVHARAWNFGPDVQACVPVEEMIRLFERAWGRPVEVVETAPAWRDEPLLMLDSRRAVAELGWRPRLSVEEAVAWSVAWYRAWREGGADAARRRTLDDIDAYERCLAADRRAG